MSSSPLPTTTSTTTATSTCTLLLLLLQLLMVAILPVAPVVGQQVSDTVKTSLGSVQGLRKTVRGRNIGHSRDREVDVYYGIPFAKPPVGDLRFKHPKPADPWPGVKRTVTKPNSCFQTLDTAFGRFPGVDMWNPNTPMSEDCLYLNVWVPRGFGDQPPRTTLVWIFGGGFWAGTSTLDVYDGSNLAASENVIVVSLNYRLGALGFLYSDSKKDKAPGNQGLMDQVMALKWIHENIAAFGGHQDSITLFGESAGAVSVGFHLMSPLSMNYFTRAILQSASPVAHWTVRSKVQSDYRTRRLAALLCPPSTPTMTCLLQADAQNITDTMWDLNTFYFEVPFAPIVDGHGRFLPDHPRTLMAQGKVKDTEIILGVVRDEGTFWLLYGFPQQFPFDNAGSMSKRGFHDVVHGINFNGEERRDKAIISQYVDSVLPQDRDSYRDVADDMSGDDLFKCPVVNFAQEYAALSESHAVYVYSFEHRLSNNPWPKWTGVMHGYEIEAMFGLPLEFNYTARERQLGSRVTGYWTRFAQFGDPNGASSGGPKKWLKMTQDGLEYLHIAEEGDKVEYGLRHSECSFRENVLPLLEEDLTTNVPLCMTGGGRRGVPPLPPSLLLSLSCLLSSAIMLLFTTRPPSIPLPL